MNKNYEVLEILTLQKDDKPKKAAYQM